MLSSKSLTDQYMALEPKFRGVFEKYDTGNKGYLDKHTFVNLEEDQEQGLLLKDMKAYTERVQKAKDCFHKPMTITKINWDNVSKDSDDHVTWELFWSFLTSEKMLMRIEKDGLRTTFLAFHLWGVPSWQEEFVNLKPRFIAAFKKFDFNGNGFLDSGEERETMEKRLLGARPDLEDTLDQMDDNKDGKITWGEFWKFFSTGDNFPTDQAELAAAHKLLEALEADVDPSQDLGNIQEADGDEEAGEGEGDEVGEGTDV